METSEVTILRAGSSEESDALQRTESRDVEKAAMFVAAPVALTPVVNAVQAQTSRGSKDLQVRRGNVSYCSFCRRSRNGFKHSTAVSLGGPSISDQTCRRNDLEWF
jgi:hypothetical protein